MMPFVSLVRVGIVIICHAVTVLSRLPYAVYSDGMEQVQDFMQICAWLQSVRIMDTLVSVFDAIPAHYLKTFRAPPGAFPSHPAHHAGPCFASPF